MSFSFSWFLFPGPKIPGLFSFALFSFSLGIFFFSHVSHQPSQMPVMTARKQRPCCRGLWYLQRPHFQHPWPSCAQPDGWSPCCWAPRSPLHVPLVIVPFLSPRPTPSFSLTSVLIVLIFSAHFPEKGGKNVCSPHSSGNASTLPLHVTIPGLGRELIRGWRSFPLRIGKAWLLVSRLPVLTC